MLEGCERLHSFKDDVLRELFRISLKFLKLLSLLSGCQDDKLLFLGIKQIDALNKVWDLPVMEIKVRMRVVICEWSVKQVTYLYKRHMFTRATESEDLKHAGDFIKIATDERT